MARRLFRDQFDRRQKRRGELSGVHRRGEIERRVRVDGREPGQRGGANVTLRRWPDAEGEEQQRACRVAADESRHGRGRRDDRRLTSPRRSQRLPQQRRANRERRGRGVQMDIQSQGEHDPEQHVSSKRRRPFRDRDVEHERPGDERDGERIKPDRVGAVDHEQRRRDRERHPRRRAAAETTRRYRHTGNRQQAGGERNEPQCQQMRSEHLVGKDVDIDDVANAAHAWNLRVAEDERIHAKSTRGRGCRAGVVGLVPVEDIGRSERGVSADANRGEAHDDGNENEHDLSARFHQPRDRRCL